MRIIARFCILLTFLQPFGMTTADTSSQSPNVELTPDEVIVIVVDALKNNDPSKDDSGIATVFDFASPGNKSATGPLSRFTQMIKGGFGNMLNHIDSEFGLIEIEDDTALQAVWLTTRAGQRIGYVFQVGKQTGGDFDGMWMTESVWPIGEREPQGQSI